MDFTPGESQQAVASLAAEVLTAADPWKELAKAGLLSLGVLDTAALLTEIGRRTPELAMKALATVMTGAIPVDRWGAEKVKQELLPAVASGEIILTAAIREAPLADQAALILVSVGNGVALVDPEGVTLARIPTSSGYPTFIVQLDQAPIDMLGGLECAQDLERLAVAGACALLDGAVAGALALTRDHVATRRQFGRALAEFQAVSQQIADVYIASRTMHLATLSACWRLDENRDPDADLRVAGYWCAGQASKAVRLCHHLHGGLGMDVTYPLHRFSSLVMDLTRYLGGAEYRLEGTVLEGTVWRAMFIDLSAEQFALRAELRGYFAGLMSPAEHAELLTERHGAVYRDVVRRMGRDGWLGVGWPQRFGGRGFGQMEQQIFADEAARADVPLPAVTLQTVGPTLQEHGTPWQQDFFLPPILRGELHFAIGYTEPEAGTDLASLRTRAVRDGDDYVVDGQKIFTTGAHAADYVWLACRTDAGAPRHKGISILIVDTKDPGFSWTPIITHDGAHHVNATYYSGVRVPARMRVGPENGGWRLITTQLNHERVMLGPAGRIAVLHDRVRAWAAGRSLLAEPDVRRALARASAVIRVNELLNWYVASSGGLGGVVPPGASRAAPELNVADASVTKVFSSEQVQVIGQELAEVVGRHADADPATAELMTWLDVQLKRNIVLTFGGGVNEVQRELIAIAGLGLPRAPR